MPRRLPSLALALLSVLVGCGEPAHDQLTLAGEAMGTTYSVKVIVAPGFSEQRRFELDQAVARAIDEVNRKMSTYLDDSELSRLNRAPADEPFPLSAETLEVLVAARRIGELSDGALDVTVGPLVNAWGFGPEERREPDQAEIDRLLAATGWDKITIDAAGSTVTKNDADVYVDLSAIAKGYAVDRVSQLLSSEPWGFKNHLAELGGEVRVSGVNAEGRAWRVAVEKPMEGQRAIQRVLPLEDAAMATSGDYRNYYEVDGERVSHEIDPKTGRSVRHRTAAVTVIADTCAEADGWATALIVMGEESGLAKASELGLAALFLVREGDDFVERATPAFEQRFPSE